MNWTMVVIMKCIVLSLWNVYHYSQLLFSIIIKRVYIITTDNKSINKCWWYISDIVVSANKSVQQKQFISSWYKYQWIRLN